jgi:hypothetical protein
LILLSRQAAHGEIASYPLVLPPQESLIAIQVELPGGNTLDNIFPSVPEGSQVSKFDAQTGQFTLAVFQQGAWTPNVTLSPGEGAYFSNAGPALTLTISGETIIPSLPVQLIQGQFHLLSRQIPEAGDITLITGVSPEIEDQILRFDPLTQSFSSYLFGGDDWYTADGTIVTPPIINAGESILYFRAGRSVDPCLLSVVRQPGSVSMIQRCGGSDTNCATFSVEATGTEPISFQWFANGLPIAGATGSVFTLCPVLLTNDGTQFSVKLSNACTVRMSRVATLTVRCDTTPPVLTGPSNLTVQCFADVPPVNPGLVSAVDSCGNPLPVSHIGDEVSGNCEKTMVRTYQATDACGNVGTYKQVVTVRDTTPPVLTCPSNLTVQCIVDVPMPNPAGLLVSDNCDPMPVVVHVGDVASGSCPKIILRTYTATDVCGNVATCTQVITVQDTIAPVLSCPADITATAPAGQLGASVAFNVTALDACDGPVPVAFSSGPGFYAIGTTVVTCEAVDHCGNTNKCSFKITVLAPAEEDSVACCSFTQGFYGNANGKFNGVTSRMLVSNLLGQGTLVIGKAGARSLSILPADGDLLQLRLPAGGTPSKLSSTGDQSLRTSTISLNRKGRFDNVFVGQTITLSLNLRLSPALAEVGIAPGFFTRAVLPGADGRKGTRDDEPVSGDVLAFQIPDSVRAALASPSVGIQSPTVRGLLELANRALAGQPTGGASTSEINDAVDSINRGFDECRQLVDGATETSIPDSFNDRFDDRPSLGNPDNHGNVQGRVSNFGAQKESSEPNHCDDDGGRSVWWRWHCPRSGPVLLTTVGSSMDTLLAVYTGNTLANLKLVGCNDDSEHGTLAELIFDGIEGTEYQFVVDAFERGSGTVVLSLVIDRPKLCPPVLGPNGEVSMCVDGPRGLAYTVEASADLNHWTPVAGMRNTSGVLRFRDEMRGTEPHRFYRAKLEF